MVSTLLSSPLSLWKKEKNKKTVEGIRNKKIVSIAYTWTLVNPHMSNKY